MDFGCHNLRRVWCWDVVENVICLLWQKKVTDNFSLLEMDKANHMGRQSLRKS